MKKIGLSVYALEVSKKNGETNINDLINGKSFIDLIEEYHKNGKEVFDDDPINETVFKFERVEKKCVEDENGRNKYSYILGTVKTGEYGTESEIVDKETGKTSYNKKENEAEVIPFSFMIAIPSGEYTMGLAIFQSEGRNGMKSVFEKRMRKFIRRQDENIKFGFGELAPKYYVEKIIRDGFLKQIKMTRFIKDDDITRALGVNNGVELKEDRIIHNPISFFRKEKNIEKLMDCLKGKAKYDELVRIPDFDYDILKFVIKTGEREKTINMNNIDAVVITIDITKEIGITSGHPALDKVKPLMISTAEDYLKQMKLLE